MSGHSPLISSAAKTSRLISVVKVTSESGSGDEDFHHLLPSLISGIDYQMKSSRRQTELTPQKSLTIPSGLQKQQQANC
jgi:hypothetical protein